MDCPHRTFWLPATPIIVPPIQFHASTQASSEMESGDTNPVYGVMDSVGTTYMYMTNMIQTSLATNQTEFGHFRISRSNNHSCVGTFAWKTSTLHAGRIRKWRDVQSLGLDPIPSIVGTGSPVASNWFCVSPLHRRTGDSVMLDNLRSLRGREKYKTRLGLHKH